MKPFMLLLACLIAPLAQAQSPDLLAREQPPQVWINPESGLQPIRLGDLDIDIRTQGFVAKTTLELRFDNPNGRVLEGEFVFPLAAGQTVAGYALEVNGQMREGVVVDKETARVAFEETSRRQIDPGLAELTAGNVFRTRLYPIPANGSKRIRLHLEATLSDQGSNWRYLLPMHFKDVVERLHVRAEAALGEQAPTDAAGDLRFDRSGSAWIAEFTRKQIQPRSELAFLIPKGDAATQVEAADKFDPAWRSLVALIDSGRPQTLESGKPGRIALFFDASASARDRNRQRETAVLREWFKLLGKAEVQLLVFRNDADPALRFDIHNGDASALLKAIDALPLDGGSSYGAIDLSKIAQVDQVLLIGDGLSNFGDSEPRLVDVIGKRPPVLVMHAAQRADHARLAGIARSGGSTVLDLATHENAVQAAQQLLQAQWRLLSVESSGDSCRDISPQAPVAVDAKLRVTARCRGRGELTLHFGNGRGDDVVRKLSYGQNKLASGALSDSVHRLWAQAWLAELATAAKPDNAAMIAIGKRYGVVTSGTSLLVLDRIEDYVRYRVEPKEPALMAEYRRLLDAQPKTNLDPGRDARMQSLIQRWREFRDYHAANYPGIETLLLPMAETEYSAWPDNADPQWKQGRARAKALLEQSQALATSWLQEGAEADKRGDWERRAAHVVFALEALRQQRSQLPQIAVSDARGARMQASSSNAEIAQATESSPTPSSPPPPAPPPPAEPSLASPAARMSAAAPMPSDASAEQSKASNDSVATAAPPLSAQIELSGWNPDTPYLTEIRAAKDPYAAYLEQREANGTMPAFYLDVADYLREQGKSPRLALRVLSNLAELDTGNTALIRVLAYRLGQWKLFALAVPQFEAALEQRPEEPQSYRDLALALAQQPHPDRARAIDLLWQVAIGDWHGRFPDIEIIALHELNDVLAQAPDGTALKLEKLAIPAELLDPVAVGLRVVLSWDADNTDIDLWVVDPSGDKAVYSQPRTRTGGHMSRDFTGGYGPEVFSIRRPLPGTYVVFANYFGDRRQSLTGPVTIQLEFQTRFGSAHSQRAATTRRLESGKQTIEIGKFKVGAE